MWSVTWPFVKNPAQVEYCPIFLRACVRLSYTCHFNFSQYFGGLNHVNHTFSECTSSRLTIFASLTTWTNGTTQTTWTTCTTGTIWSNWTTLTMLDYPDHAGLSWPLVTPWPHRLTIQPRPPGPPCPRGQPGLTTLTTFLEPLVANGLQYRSGR